MVGLLRTPLLNCVVDLMYPLCCVVLKIKKSWILNPKVWDEITYPFLNFNGATVEVYE